MLLQSAVLAVALIAGQGIQYTKAPITPVPALYFVLSVDDNSSAAQVAFAQDVAAVVEGYGGHMTWFVTGGELDASEQAIAANLSSRGHEISNHTWSHYYVDVTAPITFTSTNTNPTVNVDAAGSQLILTCDEVGNRVTLQWSVTSKSLADLQTAISGKGWTATPFAQVMPSFKLSSLADSGGAKPTPYVSGVDTGAPDYRLWRDEWLSNSAFIASVTGKTPTTAAWPGGTWKQSAQDYLYSVGVHAMRTTSSGPDLLASVDMSNVASVMALDIVGDGTQATIRAAAAAAYTSCSTNGGCVYHLWGHTAAEMSIQQVTWFVDEIVVRGGRWITFEQAVNQIRTTLTTTDSGLHYLRQKAIP